MQQHPLVSVLMPAYNHEAFVTTAIESVWAQHEANVELIVIDDGSTDQTGVVAERMAARSPIPMRVVRQANRGIARTLNRAIDMAHGDFVCFLASDDKFGINRIQKTVDRFQAQPRLKAVIHNGLIFSDEEGIYGPLYNRSVIRALKLPVAELLRKFETGVDPFVYVQTCLFRRDFLRQIGGFDESLAVEDWGFLIQMFRNLSCNEEFAVVDEPLLFYRRHGRNSTKDLDKHLANLEAVLVKYVPVELHERAYANVLWNLGTIAMFSRTQKMRAWKYFWRSQRYEFKPGRIFSVLPHGARQGWRLVKMKAFRLKKTTAAMPNAQTRVRSVVQ